MEMVPRSPFIFSKKYISKINVILPIVIKFYDKHHQVGERLHKIFGLIGLELWLPWKCKVHRLSNGKTIEIFSDTMRSTGYIFSM